MTRNDKHHRNACARRGSALLEGIIAIMLLALAIAIVGGQMNAGMDAVTQSRDLGRSLMLARSKLAELETGLIQPEELVEGNFGKVYPGHSWRMEILPTQTPDLFHVKVEILEGVLDAPMDSADDDEYEDSYQYGDDFEPRVIYSAFTYRATPATVDLQRDFGFTEDQLAQLGGENGDGLIPGFDLTGEFNMSDLLSLPLEDLLALIPMIAQAFGGNLGQLSGLENLSRDDLAEALQGMGATGDLSDGLGSGGEGAGGENAGAGSGSNGTGSGNASSGDTQSERDQMIQEMEEILREKEDEINNGGGGR